MRAKRIIMAKLKWWAYNPLFERGKEYTKRRSRVSLARDVFHGFDREPKPFQVPYPFKHTPCQSINHDKSCFD